VRTCHWAFMIAPERGDGKGLSLLYDGAAVPEIA
jgi:hypothetical protein